MRPKKLRANIVGEMVVLKRHLLKLAPLMFDYVDRDRVRLRQFLPWVDQTRALTDSENYIRFCDRKRSSCEYFDYGIFRIEDKMYVGNIGVSCISWPNNRCELSYWIYSDFEGKGYISSAIRALEKCLFEHGFNRVEIQLDPRNRRSALVPKRCGYKFEGVLRGFALESGEYRDMAVYSKLAREADVA